MHKVLIIAMVSLCLAILLFSYSPQSQNDQARDLVSTSAISHVSPHVEVFSSCLEGNQYLFVPLNSSGISVFPYWQIYLFGTGNFKLTVNNSVAESGISVNSVHISYTWNESKGNRTFAVLQFNGVNYTFRDIISGPLNDQVIESVFVRSTLQGQNQVLAAETNVSGDLMYPTWEVQMQSTENLNFSIYVNGKEITQGSVLGSRNVTFNVSGYSVSVEIILGQKTYSYPNELISSIPISRYYGPRPPPLVATALDVAIAFVRGIVIVFLAILSGMLLSRRYIMAKKDMEPQRRW